MGERRKRKDNYQTNGNSKESTERVGIKKN